MGFRSPWKNKTSIAIFLFIVLILTMFYFEANAEADTNFELSGGGVTWIGGERYDSETLIFNETWDDRKYQLGIGLQFRVDCIEGNWCERGEDDSNQFAYIQRLVRYKDFEMGFGISYWHNPSPAFNSHTPYVLSIGWNFTDNWAVNYKHFSTGGASTNNGGLDTIFVRYSF